MIGQPYNTLNYVARIANVNSNMTDLEYNAAVNDAVDEICRLNLTGNYRKVYEKT